LTLKSSVRYLHFLKPGRHKPIDFLFIHLCHVSCGDAGIAVGAKYRAVMLGKVQHPVNNPLVVHLHEVAFAHFLIMGNECFAMGAVDRQDVAATDFFAVWVWVNGYGEHPYSPIIFISTRLSRLPSSHTFLRKMFARISRKKSAPMCRNPACRP